jgi:Flp pilus assembly protein TadB
MCYKVLDKCSGGVLQLEKRSEIMKNRNPYLGLMVLWIGAICFSLSACVVGIVSGVLWQALFNLALVILDCTFLGWCICNFQQYREFEKSAKEFNAYLQMLIEKEKAKENEPFKEFENNGK